MVRGCCIVGGPLHGQGAAAWLGAAFPLGMLMSCLLEGCFQEMER